MYINMYTFIFRCVYIYIFAVDMTLQPKHPYSYRNNQSLGNMSLQWSGLIHVFKSPSVSTSSVFASLLAGRFFSAAFLSRSCN